MSLDRLAFAEVQGAYPERYEKVDLAASRFIGRGGGGFVVHRDGADEGHPCRLVRAMGEYWGRCECRGYEHHDGPCSHLCGLRRAAEVGLVDVPPVDVAGIVPGETASQQAASQHVDQQLARTDGGRGGQR